MTWPKTAARRARANCAALALVVLGVLLPSASSPAAAADDACRNCLTVYVVDSGGRRLATYVFTAADIDGKTDIYDADDQGSYAFGRGTSVNQVITKLLRADDVGEVTSATVTNTFQTDELSGNDLAAAGSRAASETYENGYPPAFTITSSEQQLQYVRQKRRGERVGANVTSSRPISMMVETRQALFTPVLKIDGSTSVKVDQPVTFHVTYPDGREPNQPRYIWTFGDGQVDDRCGSADSIAQADLTHRWRSSGNPSVQVSVCASGQTEPTRTQAITMTVGPKPTPSAGPAAGGGESKNGTANGLGKGKGKVANGSQNGVVGGAGARAAAAAAAGAVRAAAEARRALGQPETGTTNVAGLLLVADKSEPFVAADSSASSPVAAAASRRPGEIPRDWRWLLGLLPVVLLAGGMVRQTRWLAPRLPQPPWRST